MRASVSLKNSLSCNFLLLQTCGNSPFLEDLNLHMCKKFAGKESHAGQNRLTLCLWPIPMGPQPCLVSTQFHSWTSANILCDNYFLYSHLSSLLLMGQFSSWTCLPFSKQIKIFIPLFLFSITKCTIPPTFFFSVNYSQSQWELWWAYGSSLIKCKSVCGLKDFNILNYTVSLQSSQGLLLSNVEYQLTNRFSFYTHIVPGSAFLYFYKTITSK